MWNRLIACLLLSQCLWLAESHDAVVEGDNAREDNDRGAGELGMLLLIMFDGFRHDYLEKTDTPNFDRLVEGGAKPRGTIPAFTSKTFPGHYTVATGLYQESHGIIGNKMYDPVFDSTFNKGTVEPRWWDAGEPIWVTNQKNGGRTVSVFYPGDGVNISGNPATYHQPAYDEALSFNDRVDIVVGLMENGSANLGLIYFHQPDRTGHDRGPDSPEIIDAIKLCDNTLGYLLDQLTNAGLIDRVNIIVTSDHGMTAVAASRTVFLNDYLDPSLYFYTENDPVFGIWPHNETTTMSIYQALAGSHPNLTVYLKADIPDELHYRDNRRIAPILAFVDEGWNLWTDSSVSDDWQVYKGNHGYLGTLRTMSAMFIASGPAFREGYQSSESFETIEIYSLMCHLLGISPAPNNGTLSNVQWLLADSVASTQAQTTSYATDAFPRLQLSILLLMSSLIVIAKSLSG